MEEKQELEWSEAQKIDISADLVAAAEQQLRFLAAVDRRRSLYEGPVLDRAIHRYKTCWLPLLAKHTEYPQLEGSLVVPLDCEWIWHCHRLNPVQYKIDCQEFYGRILDNQNVESSLLEKSKHQMEELWANLYPVEPFELDFSNPLLGINGDICSGTKETITYDLVSAVKRQSSFYYQVSRPSMHDKRFLEDAICRYKGFLHLIKRNQERSLKCFCVPTYDIDLMWHSHQLQPVSYCKDTLEVLGKVLEHDDTDSDRSKGKKLDSGYSETTKQWEDRYGLRYWRAGAMYRGSVPTPLAVASYPSGFATKNEIVSIKSEKFLDLPQKMVVEVLLEVVGVKNLPDSQKGNLYVSFSKKQPDAFFSGSCKLNISSEAGKKVAAGFECEPHGVLVLALMSSSTSNSFKRPAKTIGKTSIPLQHLMDPDSELSIERWFELKPVSGNADFKLVALRVAASFTVPVPSPLVLNMVKVHPTSMTTCLLPLNGKLQQMRGWTRFTDDNGDEIVRLQMRNLKTTGENENTKREVVGMTRMSRKPRQLAEYAENKWLLRDSDFSLHTKSTGKDGLNFELSGDSRVELFYGKKLDYEPKNSKDQNQNDFITAVEFSAEHPYGKAVALFGVKSGLLEVSEKWFAQPAIVLAFIISSMLKKGGHTALTLNGESANEIFTTTKANTGVSRALATAVTVNEKGDVGVMGDSDSGDTHTKTLNTGGCGAGCGGGCGAMSREASGGCGAGCGGGCGGCGAMSGEGSGGCGAGCGGGCGGCGVAVKSSGCGSGCGGGCGAEVSASGAAREVSRPSMRDKRFLEDAVSRYKGFFHLIKRNQETSLKCFCVLTYDIDLMWHSHQLQPVSYCKDMLEDLGKVLEHDDTDSDRSKGKKLDSGYSETTKQWEDHFGSRYRRAGAMYRGSVCHYWLRCIHLVLLPRMRLSPSNLRNSFIFLKRWLWRFFWKLLEQKACQTVRNKCIFQWQLQIRYFMNLVRNSSWFQMRIPWGAGLGPYVKFNLKQFQNTCKNYRKNFDAPSTLDGS